MHNRQVILALHAAFHNDVNRLSVLVFKLTHRNLKLSNTTHKLFKDK